MSLKKFTFSNYRLNSDVILHFLFDKGPKLGKALDLE